MKILVAGGCGYIGSVLVPKLLERNYQVDVIDNMWFGNSLTKYEGKSNLNVIKQDIMDVEIPPYSYEAVIFLAGLSNDPMAESFPNLNFIYNAAHPAILAYKSKIANIPRFIYASSCSVYGYAVERLFDESMATTVQFPYGVSKLQGEAGVMQLQDKDFSVICLRKGTVNGYSPRMRFDLVINAMFKSALTKEVINVHNPSLWRPLVSVDDSAIAYIRALESSPEVNGIFNIIENNYTVGGMADAVKRILDEQYNMNISLNIEHRPDLRNYKVSSEKASRLLGFTAIDNIDKMVYNLIENKDKFKNYEQDEYYNIRQFKKIMGE